MFAEALPPATAASAEPAPPVKLRLAACTLFVTLRSAPAPARVAALPALTVMALPAALRLLAVKLAAPPATVAESPA